MAAQEQAADDAALAAAGAAASTLNGNTLCRSRFGPSPHVAGGGVTPSETKI